MKSKLQQNAIVTGYINSFCLVCECHLDSEAVVLWHIDQYEHQKNLDLFPYLEKYRNDSIRKLKNGYFCEYCNKLLSSISNVNLHIHETYHDDNKVYKSFQRVNGSIIAFDKIIIDEKAWHSLSENTCVICNKEFDNEEIHKSDANHVIKLVQSTVKFHGNGVYRVVDDDIFQCLTCNTLSTCTRINEHFNGTDHQKLYTGCQRSFENKYGAIRKEDKEKKIKEMVEQYFFGIDPDLDADEINDDEYFGYIPIDFPATSASSILMCLRSDSGKMENACTSREGETNSKTAVSDAKILHNNNDGTSNYNFRSNKNTTDVFNGKKQDEDKPIVMRDSEESEISDIENAYTEAQSIFPARSNVYVGDSPEEFAMGSFMVMAKPRAGHVYCKLCTSKIRFLLDEMKHHVRTRKHMALAALAAFHDVSTRSSVYTYPVREFVPFRMAMIEFIFDSRYSQDRSDVVVNKTFCVTVASFNLVYNVSDTHMLCHICNYRKPFEDSDVHLDKSSRHVMGMNMSLVLTELREELVREITTNKFHCGFCNLVVTSLRDLKDHLKGGSHKEHKLSAYQRLHQTLPASGQLEAIAAIEEDREFTPNWTGRPTPGIY